MAFAGLPTPLQRVPMHLRVWKPRPASVPFLPAQVSVTDTNDIARGPMDLKIVSYNVLAEQLEENTTAGLDPAVASWNARKLLLAEELDSWGADIICLQEVDHYHDFFQPFLAERSVASSMFLIPCSEHLQLRTMTVFE